MIFDTFNEMGCFWVWNKFKRQLTQYIISGGRDSNSFIVIEINVALGMSSHKSSTNEHIFSVELICY